MKVTKSIRNRHMGLMAVIKKEIALNEKFLAQTIDDGERIRIKNKLRHQEEESMLAAKTKNFNELNEFKKEKGALLKQLVGTGQRKQKIKDMSLGSESGQVVEETMQNKAALDRLLQGAHDQKRKLDAIGLPLSVIKEEYFGNPDLKKKRSKSPPLSRSSTVQQVAKKKKLFVNSDILSSDGKMSPLQIADSPSKLRSYLDIDLSPKAMQNFTSDYNEKKEELAE